MFKVLSEGSVFLEKKDKFTYAVPRTALLPDGGVVCCFHRTSGGGVNDFTPLLCYSSDGINWTKPVEAWPELAGKKAAVVSPRTAPDGRVSFAGKWWDIDAPGELWWSEEVGGMKENSLCWCISEDGRALPPLRDVPMPFYAGAEQPGGMLIRRDGVFMMMYSPCLTIEAREPVITNQEVMLTSTDGGQTFTAMAFGKLDRPATYAESWVVELSDDRLMTCSWITDGPDVFFLSEDRGKSFTGPIELPFGGQTMSLTPYGDGLVLIPYNYRTAENSGVRLALARPSATGAEILSCEQVWTALTAMKDGRGVNFDNFTSYAFGEPQVTIMPDGTLLLVIWVDQPDGTGVKSVRLAIE